VDHDLVIDQLDAQVLDAPERPPVEFLRDRPFELGGIIPHLAF
jgi:hypothetical protein